MPENKNVSTNGIMWVCGIVLTLLIWGLQLIGVVDSLILGCLTLSFAFFVLMIAFWRWEAALTVPIGFKASMVVMFAVIYFGSSSMIVWKKYSNHPKEATARDLPALATPDESKFKPTVGPFPASLAGVPVVSKSGGSLQRPLAPSVKKKDKRSINAQTEVPVSPSVQPSTQSCPNGICIGGDNYGNPQIFNAPQPIAFTPEQLKEIGDGMGTFAGRKVTITTDGINDETMGLSGSLKSA